MKTLLVGIAFAMGMAFNSQAFATDLPDCPKGGWKHGHYVCGDIQFVTVSPARQILSPSVGWRYCCSALLWA
jgi:hypothetical protein